MSNYSLTTHDVDNSILNLIIVIQGKVSDCGIKRPSMSDGTVPAVGVSSVFPRASAPQFDMVQDGLMTKDLLFPRSITTL